MRRVLRRIMSGFGTGQVASVGLALVLLVAPLSAKADNIQNGLTRLSEILGSIHHLRDVCGANDGPLWRNKMIDMINIANLDQNKRQAMISHFNDAYYDARTRYPMCTRDAAKRANRLFDEAHKLAARLADDRRNAASLF